MPNYESFFFAKQPILDDNLGTYGFELLFRSSLDHDRAELKDPEMATINMVSCAFVKAQENTRKDKRIFINFTERLLREGAPRALPPSVLVIEVLEDVCQSEAVLSEILRYKQEGYLVAIDDYHGGDSRADFLDLADIIKVDVLDKSEAEIGEVVRSLEGKRALRLAEKVEGGAAYRALQPFGFDLFQGYFFSRPENFSGKKISSAKVSRVRTLALLQEPDLETARMTEIVNSDPSLAYRLLRLLNSAAFGFSMKIESVQHAVVLLGLTRLKYWLQMVILSDVNSSSNPRELFNQALQRGKTLEELALDGHVKGCKPETIFLFGLLSLLDVMLDTPFSALLADIPVSAQFKAGYFDEASELNRYLQLLRAFEAGEPEKSAGLCRTLGIPLQACMEASVRAHAWSEAIAEEIM